MDGFYFFPFFVFQVALNVAAEPLRMGNVYITMNGMVGRKCCER